MKQVIYLQKQGGASHPMLQMEQYPYGKDKKYKSFMRAYEACEKEFKSEVNFIMLDSYPTDTTIQISDSDTVYVTVNIKRN